MGAWRPCKLGDLLEIKHGFAFLGKHFANAGSHIVLTPGSFYDEGGFKDKAEKEKWYNGPIPAEYVLNTGDVIVVMTEQAEGLLGSSAIIPRSGVYLHNQRLGLVRIHDESKTDRRFVYHLFNTESVRQQIRASASGVKIRHTAPTRIAEVKVGVPPFAVQTRIASILSSYDDLIENNTRRIKILEVMAQMVYHEWFVNFRSPGHEKFKFVQSEFGQVPEGWCQSYADHVDFLEGPGLRRWQYRDSGLRFLNIRTIANGDIDLSMTQFVDPTEAETKYKHFLLSEYDHVVSSSGTIGRIVTVRREHLPLMLNTSVIRMRPRTESVGRWQLKHFLKSDYFQTQIKAFASGVAQMNFGPSHLKEMKIIAPPTPIGRAYEELVAPMDELICTLTAKNAVLRQTRNELLPRLVSGEIRVEHLQVVTARQIS